MKKGVVVILAICTVASAFAQGLYWQSRTEGTVGEHMTDMYAVPKKMKIVQHGQPSASGRAAEQADKITIIRLDKQIVWHLDPAKRTYSEMTFAQIEATIQKAGGKMDAAMEKMKREMANMSPEERRMVEQMMGNKMPGAQDAAPVRVENTGDRKTISGFACTKYVVRSGSDQVMTLWVTRDVRGFDEMRNDWKAFSERMAAMTARFGKEMADAYKSIDGFPIQTEMGQGVVTTVTRVERRSTPAPEFEIPSGYTKVRSELEDAMQEMEREQE
jgi:hypothetical protein